jgi:hypothetical protein
MRGEWLLLFGLVSCGDAAVPEGSDSSAAASDPVAQDRSAEPTLLADLAPGDTAGVLDLIRRTMNDRNAAATAALRRDSVMASEGYREPRRLTLWTIDDLPVKLIATEPNDAGLMTGETIAWFVAGEVRVVQEPFAVLYLEADRLVLWSDEGMVPLAIPEADRMARERAVIDSVKSRLAKFGVTYP